MLCAGLRAQRAEVMHVERGLGVPGRCMQLRSHRTEISVADATESEAAVPVLTALVS